MSTTLEQEQRALIAKLNDDLNGQCDEIWRLQNDLTAAKHTIDETTVALAEATQRVADLTDEVTALRAETKRAEVAETSLRLAVALGKPHLVVDNGRG